MPTLNVDQSIRECLESLLREEIVFEVLVIDDGSTDRTATVVSDVAALDERVRLSRNPGSGAAAGRNAGALLACGEFIAFVDGDDISLPGGLGALSDALTASGSDFAVGDYVVTTPRDEWLRSSTLPVYGIDRQSLVIVDEPQLLRDRTCWNKLFRRCWWTSSGITFTDSHQSNDIAAMTAAYLRGTFDVVARPVYQYRRLGGKSMTARRAVQGGTASYVEQERTCFNLVRAAGISEVMAVYLDGVLAYDLWFQLGDVLRSLAEGAEPQSKVSDAIVSFLGRLPDQSFARLPDERRDIYALVRRGRLDLAGWLHASPGGALVLLDQQVNDLVEILGEGGRASLTRGLRRCILGPLLGQDSREALSAEELAAMVRFQRRAVPRARLTALELAFVDAAARGDVQALAAVRCLRTDPVTAALRTTDRTAEIWLSWSLWPEGLGDELTLVQDERIVSVPIERTQAGCGVARLSVSSVPSGDLAIYLKYGRGVLLPVSTVVHEAPRRDLLLLPATSSGGTARLVSPIPVEVRATESEA